MRFPLLILAALIPGAAQAQACVGEPGGGRVRLETEVTALHNAAGEVAITVYPDDRSRFLSKGGKLARARVPAVQPVTRACFWLPPGSYAVAVYHDENADHNFNRTLWAPKEGFGFSNDAPTSIGLPSLGDARFALPAAGRAIRITMRYHR